jgi:hypothetical protein
MWLDADSPGGCLLPSLQNFSKIRSFCFNFYKILQHRAEIPFLMPSMTMDSRSITLQRFTQMPTPTKMEFISVLFASMKAEELEESVHQLKTTIRNRKIEESIKEDTKLAGLDPAFVRLDPDSIKRKELGFDEVEWMSEKYDFLIGPTGRIFTAYFYFKKDEIDTKEGELLCQLVIIKAKYRGLRAQSGTQFDSYEGKCRMQNFFWDSTDEPQHIFVGLKELLHLVWEDLGLPILEDGNEVVKSLLNLFWGRWATEKIGFTAAEGQPEIMQVEQPTIMDIVLQELLETKNWDSDQRKWICC